MENWEKSKNHVMRTQLLQIITPIQQKGQRTQIHLEKRVETELNRLVDQKHIKKLGFDKQFISPIVTTVKKDQTFKLALDSNPTNKFIPINIHTKAQL